MQSLPIQEWNTTHLCAGKKMGSSTENIQTAKIQMQLHNSENSSKVVCELSI